MRNASIHRVNVGDLLRRSARRTPNKEFLFDGAERWSYGEFDAWSNQVANGLASLGLKQGDAVALMSGNCAEFLAVYFACARLGLICVPINLLWRQGELAHVVAHSEARAAIVEAPYLAQFLEGAANAAELLAVVAIGREGAAIPPAEGVKLVDFAALTREASAVEPALVAEDAAPLSYLYTSGTTSAPKGVVGSHLGIYLQSLGTALDTRMTDKDRASVVLPLFHTAQLNAICTPVVAAGGSFVLQRGFDAAALHELIERERLSVLFLLPMMVRRLVEEQLRDPRDLSSLRLVVYAMAAMPEAELRQAIDVLKCDFSLMFGQTEMSPVATFFKPEHQLSHPGAAGTPAANVEVAIMGLEGEMIPQGGFGEIVYRSPQTMTGYLRNPEATEEAFRHGWFHSGDLGRFDEDGILWFEDRFKDVIKSGGENVSSIEVELAIRAVAPDLTDVVAIGVPHPHWGEAITAVVGKGGADFDEAALLKALREKISPFKCPKAVIALDELPKTATGKIEKAKLRKAYADFYK